MNRYGNAKCEVKSHEETRAKAYEICRVTYHYNK
jgi:hypothetical protein